MSDQDDVKYYLWHIDNKYYTSQVLLCTTENPRADVSIEGAQALIIHHDPQKEGAEQSLEEWTSLICSMVEAEVLLFLCNTIVDATIRDKVTKWCIQKKFELVEFELPELSETCEDFDPIHNKYGIERITEALHAHMWPNMILKGKPSSGEEPTDVKEVEKQLDNIRLAQHPTERLEMESMLDGIMGGENADFGELFSQLMAMKQHAASLPTNQRRIAAEQLVTAFWKAMGGDLSEIDE